MTQSSTQDHIEGTIHKVTGTVKETLGKVLNNPSLTAEGQDENLDGKVQTKVAQIKKVFEK